jgi:uncharacterized repeat protein (TIGR01451 family)
MPVDFDISPLIPPQTPSAPSVPVTPSVTPPVSGMPPPTMPKKNSSDRLLKTLILVAAGLFVITVGSLWWGGNSFSDKGVTMTLEGPSTATSGDEITYTLSYKNATRVALTNMSFRLFYPEGSIVMKDGLPTNPESEGFIVDKLNPGDSGKKEFKLFLVGDKGAIKTGRVHLIFKAGTLRSSFEKEATIPTTIATLPVSLTLVAPPTSVAGQPIQYILDIRNDTKDDLSDLKAVFTYPDGFVVQKMQPNPDAGNTDWHIDQLKVGEGVRITVTGTLSGNERETKTVQVALQHKLNGQYVAYVQSEAFTMISSPLLSVTVTPGDSRDYVSFAGDLLKYTISYANNSRFTLLGLTLGVKLEGDMYNFAELRSDKGFFDDATKTLTYDSSGASDFSSLRPGQTGRLVFTVPLKAGLTGGGGAKNFFVKATAKLSTTNVPSGLDGSEVFASDSVITKISGQPSLIGAVLYDNGAGSGPLPPQAGAETVMTIRWQITNPGNDVRDAKIIATLPPGVTFKGGATASNGTAPAFDKTTNKVTWTIGTIPFGTGNGTPRYQATFQVSIRPGSNQAGQTVTLVSGAALTGIDSFTTQPVQVRPRDLTTADIEGHAKEGQVQ